jgi:hypothetical protein
VPPAGDEQGTHRGFSQSIMAQDRNYVLINLMPPQPNYLAGTSCY